MKKHLLLAALALASLFTLPSLQAQILLNSWTYTGGALDPDTYGTYQPSVLTPDPASSNGATIAVSGLTSGGLGSGGFPDGYGFLYTFFSASTTLTLQTSTVQAGVDTITLSMNSGGGTAYSSSSLTLNFNLENDAVAATSFSSAPGGTSDFGALTIYSWTWDVSELGLSSGFSTSWTAGSHTTFSDIHLTQQAIPEPSTYLLMGLGVVALWGFRHFSKDKKACPSRHGTAAK